MFDKSQLHIGNERCHFSHAFYPLLDRLKDCRFESCGLPVTSVRLADAFSSIVSWKNGMAPDGMKNISGALASQNQHASLSDASLLN